MYLPSSALSSVQFRSKKRGRIFWTRINAQKRPKTPKNAPKRPKTPQKRPKTPQKRPFFDLKTPVFFSSVQVSFFRSGQFRSFQVSSGQVPVVQVSSVQVNLTCRADTGIFARPAGPRLRAHGRPFSIFHQGMPMCCQCVANVLPMCCQCVANVSLMCC